jgi:hypothetical protein
LVFQPRTDALARMAQGINDIGITTSTIPC